MPSIITFRQYTGCTVHEGELVIVKSAIFTFSQRYKLIIRGRGYFNGEPSGFSGSRSRIPAAVRILSVSQKASHHAFPCPSIRPRPVIVTFFKSCPVKSEAYTFRSIPSQDPFIIGVFAISLLK